MSLAAFISALLLVVSNASAQGPPSLPRVEATTVRLEVQKFTFASGLPRNEDGQMNGKGGE